MERNSRGWYRPPKTNLLSFAAPEVKAVLNARCRCAGLQADLQCTRPCPCGAGLLAKWPWVLQTPQLGFCPGGEWDIELDDEEVTTQSRHDWESISWRSEWIKACPGARETDGRSITPWKGPDDRESRLLYCTSLVWRD